MPFDPLIASAGRLRILTALLLTDCGQQEFVALRRATALTDGNLSSHARRLSLAGYVHIEKQFRHGKPVTRLELTPIGRQALQLHARELQLAINSNSAILPTPSAVLSDPAAGADDWID